ncbi:MAG: hypothetical protein ABSF91_11435 [Bacteroidota bacterium]|jgi:hypothetical protein
MEQITSVVVLILGIFSKMFPLNTANKKLIADGIRNLATRHGAEIEGKVRFNTSDQSVTFSVNGEDKAKKLLPDLKKTGVTATVVESAWEMAMERRATAMGSETESPAS